MISTSSSLSFEGCQYVPLEERTGFRRKSGEDSPGNYTRNEAQKELVLEEMEKPETMTRREHVSGTFVGRRLFIFYEISGKTIPHSRIGENILRPGRVFFQFLS